MLTVAHTRPPGRRSSWSSSPSRSPGTRPARNQYAGFPRATSTPPTPPMTACEPCFHLLTCMLPNSAAEATSTHGGCAEIHLVNSPCRFCGLSLCSLRKSRGPALVAAILELAVLAAGAGVCRFTRAMLAFASTPLPRESSEGADALPGSTLPRRAVCRIAKPKRAPVHAYPSSI